MNIVIVKIIAARPTCCSGSIVPRIFESDHDLHALTAAAAAAAAAAATATSDITAHAHASLHNFYIPCVFEQQHFRSSSRSSNNTEK
jgi:hypothetical protein